MKIFKKRNVLFWLVILGAVLVFCLLANGEYFEYTDSVQYIRFSASEGVTPIYPLFIHIHRILLGEQNYLYGVVTTQTVIAVVCLLFFLIWVRKRFSAGNIVSVFIFGVTMVPFIIDFPPIMINRSIITEGLSYPLFYIFTIIYVETILRKSYKWILFTAFAAVCMASIRTQMQICFVFTAAVTIYVFYCKNRYCKFVEKVCKLIFSCILCIMLIVLCEFAMLRITAFLKPYAMSGITYTEENISAEDVSGDSTNITNQFSSVLIDRTFYEMDEKDEDLFEDQEIKELYRILYNISDQGKIRYKYAERGLWKWRHIMNGTASGTRILGEAWEIFNEENPASMLYKNKQWVELTIAFELLKAHWPRMLYHTLCMLPQGLICTAFFQIEEIYGLCYIYTFSIYIFAAGLVLLGYRRKVFNIERVEFLWGVFILNALMVGIICIVFFGMQRYLIYGFGIFYTALLLILEEIIKHLKKRENIRWKK